jgi:hypothetical protein
MTSGVGVDLFLDIRESTILAGLQVDSDLSVLVFVRVLYRSRPAIPVAALSRESQFDCSFRSLPRVPLHGTNLTFSADYSDFFPRQFHFLLLCYGRIGLHSTVIPPTLLTGRRDQFYPFNRAAWASASLRFLNTPLQFRAQLKSSSRSTSATSQCRGASM